MITVPALKAGDPGLNPAPNENFSLKLTITDNSILKLHLDRDHIWFVKNDQQVSRIFLIYGTVVHAYHMYMIRVHIYLDRFIPPCCIEREKSRCTNGNDVMH